MQKKALKVIKQLIIGIMVICIVGIVWNGICRKTELPRIENAYGKEVEVNGKKMVVDVTGSQDKDALTIVLLPGLGSPTPVLEFKPLAEKLGEIYRIITVEPFGYGLSEQTNVERSVENITEELHNCLQKLGIEKYYLMAHSINGLYAVYYTNTYSEEVMGFIGIDASVPKQNENEPVNTALLNKLIAYLERTKGILGINRLFSLINSEKILCADPEYRYSDKELETFKILTLDMSYNNTIIDELKWLEKNLETVKDMKFPETVPVLNFIAEENCEVFPDWEKLHREVMGNTDLSKVILLEGGHYLHLEKKNQIKKEIMQFLDDIYLSTAEKTTPL